MKHTIIGVIGILLLGVLILGVPLMSYAAVEGDINSQLDAYTFSTVVTNSYGTPVQISEGVVCVAHRTRTTNLGYIRTFSADEDGEISEVDSLQFAAAVGDSGGSYPQIARKTGTDIYVIVWSDTSSDGWVGTIDIDSSGNIGAALIDTWEYGAANGGRCTSPIYCSGDVFAALYIDDDADDCMLTFGVQDDGTIDGLIDSWEYQDGVGNMGPVAFSRHSGTTYMVAHRLASGDLELFSFSIAANGTITKSKVDTLTSSDTPGTTNGLGGMESLADDNYFVLVYHRSTGGEAVMGKTFTCDASGSISDSWVDEETLKATRWPGIVVTEDVFGNDLLVLISEDTFVDGRIYLSTYVISSGDIGAMVDSTTVDSAEDPASQYPVVAKYRDGIYGTFYRTNWQLPSNSIAATYSISEGPSPTITDVSPVEGDQGDVVSATITGTGFTTVTDVDFGSGITVAYTIESDVEISCTLTIADDAALGDHDVTVTNPFGMDTSTGAFEVTEPPAAVYTLAAVLPYVFVGIAIVAVAGMALLEFSLAALIMGAVSIVITIVGAILIDGLIVR